MRKKKGIFKKSSIIQREGNEEFKNNFLNLLEEISPDFKDFLEPKENIDFFYHYNPKFPIKPHILRITLGTSANIISFVLLGFSPHIPDWFFLFFMGFAVFMGCLCIGSLGQIAMWKRPNEKLFIFTDQKIIGKWDNKYHVIEYESIKYINRIDFSKKLYSIEIYLNNYENFNESPLIIPNLPYKHNLINKLKNQVEKFIKKELYITYTKEDALDEITLN